MATKHNPNGSTGPKTPQGKAASSLNALRDGLYASTVLLPNEDRAEFDRLHHGIQSFYLPKDPSQQKLVDEMAALEWKIWRVELIEAGVLVELGDAPATACVQPYDRVTQVQCRLRRAWHKVLDRLECHPHRPRTQSRARCQGQPVPQTQAQGGIRRNGERVFQPGH